MSKEYTGFNCDAFWNDGYVQELDMAETAVYFHYITSPRLENSGVFKEGQRMVSFYVKTDIDTVKKVDAKLEKDGKIYRFGEWVIVPSSLKHQKFDKNPNIIKGIYDQLKTAPVEVLRKLQECGYALDLTPIVFGGESEAPYNPSEAPTEGFPNPSEAPTEGFPNPSEAPTEGFPSPSEAPTEGFPSPSEAPTEGFPSPSEAPTLDSYIDSYIDFKDIINLKTHIPEESETPGLETSQNEKRGGTSPPSETSQKIFLWIWQHTPDILNFAARIEKPKEWAAFWEKCPYPPDDIKRRMQNFIDGVRSGAIEKRFVPATPDRFVLKGHLQTAGEPYKKPESRGGTSPPSNPTEKKSLGGLE